MDQDLAWGEFHFCIVWKARGEGREGRKEGKEPRAPEDRSASLSLPLFIFSLTPSPHLLLQLSPFYVFSTGVTGNGEETGTLVFQVPFEAPATLYYQCGAHAAMSGRISIQDPPRTFLVSNQALADWTVNGLSEPDLALEYTNTYYFSITAFVAGSNPPPNPTPPHPSSPLSPPFCLPAHSPVTTRFGSKQHPW